MKLLRFSHFKAVDSTFIMGLESDLQLDQPALTVIPDIIIVENKEGLNEGNEDYADSALRAWSTVAGAFLLQFYSVGLVSELSPCSATRD